MAVKTGVNHGLKMSFFSMESMDLQYLKDTTTDLTCFSRLRQRSNITQRCMQLSLLCNKRSKYCKVRAFAQSGPDSNDHCLAHVKA